MTAGLFAASAVGASADSPPWVNAHNTRVQPPKSALLHTTAPLRTTPPLHTTALLHTTGGSTSTALSSGVFSAGQSTQASSFQLVTLTPQIDVLSMTAPFEPEDDAWQAANTFQTAVTNANSWTDSKGNPTGLPLSQSVVPAPTVTIQVPISLTDDSPNPIHPNPHWSDNDGDHGIYTAQIDECLAGGLADHADLPTATSQASGNLPEGCFTATGRAGFWYALGGGQTNLYTASSPLGPGGGTSLSITGGSGCYDAQAAAGSTINNCIQVPIQLHDIANTLRLDLDIGMWEDPGDTSSSDPAGEVTTGSTGSGDTFHSIYAEASAAIPLQPIIVQPAAVAQMKVLPYTILYRPPGDLSSATFSIADNFGTTMTVGSGTQIDNKRKTSVTSTKSVNESVSFGDAVSVGFNLAQDSTWDHTTETGYGLSSGDSTTVNASHTFWWQDCNGVCAPSSTPLKTIPGPSGPYMSEPFWQDEIEVLVHPQLAIWNFGGAPTIQQIAAVSSLARLVLADLDACVQGHPSAINNEPVLKSHNVTLSAQECASLAGLDPFYLVGQSQTFASDGAHQDKDPRFHFVTQAPYQAGHSYSLGDVQQQSVQQTHNQTSTYESSVEDVASNRLGGGITLGGDVQKADDGPPVNIGFSSSVSLSQGQSSATSNKMTVTFQQSNVSQTQTTTTIQGLLNDDHAGLSPSPSANVFFDKLFGGYLFQDPTAACNPIVCVQTIHSIVGAVGGGSRINGTVSTFVTQAGGANLPLVPHPTLSAHAVKP